MKKEVTLTARGKRADIGEYRINRILPNRYVDSVGPFVFLDHALPITHSADEPIKKHSVNPHPHRGIATLTYLLNGEADHLDSRGNHAKVFSGGAQWMKAGNGIIHDETVNLDSRTGDLVTHGFQFWINLPSSIKAEPPQYLAVQADEVPKKDLPDDSGWLKVIAGAYDGQVSLIPSYSKQFLYHIHLDAGKEFALPVDAGLESAVFLPVDSAVINDTKYDEGEFLEFDKEAGVIEIRNDTAAAIDVLVFGGEKYAEPIVFGGPFVMNTQSEVSMAYNDFYAGKYGEVRYNGKDNG